MHRDGPHRSPGRLCGVDLRLELQRIAQEYPPAHREPQLADIDRIVFNAGLVAEKAPGGSIVDIGGGTGMFTLACAAAGMKAVLIDDFAAEGDRDLNVLSIHREHGVEVVAADLLAHLPKHPSQSLDAVTAFDVMEHLHHSPRSMFHELVTSLKPGGLFVIGVPNVANLRKRLTAPFGKLRWSPFEQWYGTPVFRGHVREPCVEDLYAIAADLELTDVRVIGRNWIGRSHPNRWLRLTIAFLDKLLQRFPALCSNLYLVARRP